MNIFKNLDREILGAGMALLVSACGGGGGDAGNSGGTTVSPASPDLVFATFVAPKTANAGNNDQVGIIYTLENIGNKHATDAVGVSIAYYLSKDAVITKEDIQFNFDTHVGGLAAHEAVTESVALDIPDNISSGTYYIGAIADPYEYVLDYVLDIVTDVIHVPESNENNNVSEAVQITITGAGSCVDDAYESDDVVSDATLLAYGASNAQHHNMCLDSSDWFKLNALQGSMYVIETTSLGINADPYMGLYDSDGVTLLDSDDFSGSESSAANISFTAPRSDTYYIQVGQGDDFNSGGSQNSSGLNTDYTISIL